MSAIVSVLCETDLASLMTAMEQGNTGLIRMLNGEPPTSDEFVLIMQAGPDDLLASNKEMRDRLLRAENRLFPLERFQALLAKYGAGAKEPVREVARRMSLADFEELQMLMRWIDADERSDHGDCRA